MAILCGNCGATHDSVSDVRTCHQGAPPTDPPAPKVVAETPARPVVRAMTAPPVAAKTPVPPASLDLLAGPDALGRSLVVTDGRSPGAPWNNAPVIVVDDDVASKPGLTIDDLQDRWQRRQRYVIDLRVGDGAELGDPEVPPSPTDDRPPWQLGPEFTFAPERLHHLIWSNAVDARLPGHERLAARDEAIGRGAQPSEEADVTLADGTHAWCDGGPLTPSLDDGSNAATCLIPAASVEHGHLIALTDAGLTDNGVTADLADDQLDAVAHRGGPCRVISPAGSGKTRTLTERARHLVDGWGVTPASVCVVAFNVRAARELRERTTDLPSLHLRTLNSLGLAILTGRGPFLRPDPEAGSIQVVEERAVRDILGGLVDFPRRANTDPAAPWLEALSRVRLGLRNPGQVEDEYGGDVDGLPSVFDEYRRALADRNAVDFDEQIYGAVELLLRRPDVRHAAQRTCRVLLVDEFQDLTPAHLLMLRLLASPRLDVFGVGDDDQTIYGYNDADPRWLIDYAEFFPGAASHPLTVNYRCDPDVVGAAGHLLTHNRIRVPKSVSARPGREPSGDGLTVVESDNSVVATRDAVAAHIKAGASAGDIVVLTRINASLAPVQVALAGAGIPVDPASDESWLRRTGVRAALAWLRLALDPKTLRGRDIEETARRPARALSPKVIEWMAEQGSLSGLDRLAGRLKDRDATKVEAYADDLRLLADKAKGASTTEILSTLRTRVGLDQALGTLDGARRRIDRSSHLDDLNALAQLGELHPDASTFEAWLREQLTETGHRPPAGDDTPRVHLSTIHRVKGLEWAHVVVHEASKGLMPHRLSSDIEEERRIFHVALTRSTATTTVVTSTDRRSRFLDELDTDAPPPDPEPRGGSRSADRGTKSAPALEAELGLEFDHGGYEHRLAQIDDDGVVTSIGRARTPLAWGTIVRHLGAPRTLVRPTTPSGSGSAAGSPGGPKQAGPAAGTGSGGETDAPELVAALKEFRLAQANTQDVPAFVIFNNKSLDDIVTRMPTDEAELLECHGIGPVKLENYGAEILAIIDTHRSP